MPVVVVDGVPYFPELRESKPLVAIAITTRNRPDVLARTLKEILATTPPEFPVFIVDDASTSPAQATTPGQYGWHRFNENVGIPRAKNKCIEMCMQSGADHFFLLDDDCWPTMDGWWRPYVDSVEPHLNYIFTHWTNGAAVGDCVEVYNDGKLRAFDQARGCAMYVTRNVIERVGGFNTAFGHGMNEHLEFSQRVSNAGLTTFNYQDVVDSDELWHSLDRAQDVVRTIPTAERQALLKRNNQILESLRGSTDYVEYKDMRNLVITQLLTANVDGQRGTKWDPDPEIVRTWAESIKGATPVVITDQMEMHPNGGVHWFKMPYGWPVPHLQRWVSTLAWLREHPAGLVWLTDGSDVEMLNEPWDYMKPGTLYVGSEPVTIAKPWLAQHHPFYREWISDNPNLQMLNCGLVGGDYSTVREFLCDLVRELTTAYGQIDYEMGSFNYLLRTDKWAKRIEYGPHVCTTFKANERTEAWWKHK